MQTCRMLSSGLFPGICSLNVSILEHSVCSIFQWRTKGRGLGGFNPPPLPPKFLSFDKAEPNSQVLGIYFRNNLIRIRVSFICKLSGTPN
jgi:hypothetical protein